jgi:uncharacterized protein YbjT (DUF2867 family)
MNPVFVTGATGYIGRPLVSALIERGYSVHALVRATSKGLPGAALPVTGNALDARTFAPAIPASATLVHLIGTPHPSPAKAAQFQSVDLASIQAATDAAQRAGVRHFVYVSVAHPAPVMQAFIEVRRRGEALIEATGIPATIVRPWYVLGPGHRWPYALLPVYTLLRAWPSTRSSAERLGLVTLKQMVGALVEAVANPPVSGTHIVDVPKIRAVRT